MRNLLAFLAAAFLTFGTVGWYLGWYTVSASSEVDGHRSVHIDVNTRKMGADLHKGSEKLQETIDQSLRDDNTKRAEGRKQEAGK